MQNALYAYFPVTVNNWEGTQAVKGKKLQVHHTEHSLAVRFKRWTRQNHVYVGLKSQQQTTGETKETKAKHGTKRDRSISEEWGLF